MLAIFETHLALTYKRWGKNDEALRHINEAMGLVRYADDSLKIYSMKETLNINFQTVAGDVGELWREPYVSIGRCNVLAKRLPQMVEAGIISGAWHSPDTGFLL
jgi:hypothetical protein